MADFAQELIDHTSKRHHLSNEVCCPSCKENYAKEELQVHYELCIKKKRVVSQKKCMEKKTLALSDFKCEHCDKRFKPGSRHYWEHMKLKHLWGVFKCQTCTTPNMRYSHELMDHIVTEGHSSLASCPIKNCKKILPVSELGDHYKACYTELNRLRVKYLNKKKRSREFVCDVCGKVSKGKAAHEKHLISHARKLSKRSKSKEDDPASFFCDKCGKEFMQKEALRSHVSSVHSEIVQCEFCDYSCPKKKIKRHMLIHQEPKFGCGSCGKMLKTKQSLIAHEREHAGIRPFECNVCGKRFSEKAAVNQHKRLVHKIAGPNAKPMRRELERGITAFIVEDGGGMIGGIERGGSDKQY